MLGVEIRHRNYRDEIPTHTYHDHGSMCSRNVEFILDFSLPISWASCGVRWQRAWSLETRDLGNPLWRKQNWLFTRYLDLIRNIHVQGDSRRMMGIDGFVFSLPVSTVMLTHRHRKLESFPSSVLSLEKCCRKLTPRLIVSCTFSCEICRDFLGLIIPEWHVSFFRFVVANKSLESIEIPYSILIGCKTWPILGESWQFHVKLCKH